MVCYWRVLRIGPIHFHWHRLLSPFLSPTTYFLFLLFLSIYGLVLWRNLRLIGCPSLAPCVALPFFSNNNNNDNNKKNRYYLLITICSREVFVINFILIIIKMLGAFSILGISLTSKLYNRKYLVFDIAFHYSQPGPCNQCWSENTENGFGKVLHMV